MAHPVGGEVSGTGNRASRSTATKAVLGLGGTAAAGGFDPDKSVLDFADAGEVATHEADTTAAHAASAVSVDSTTLTGVGTDVQASLEELDNLLDTTTTTANAAAVKANFATFTIAGADNTVSNDYTATGVAASSKVFAALAFKHQDAVVADVAGTITPGANKITVAGGGDLSVGFTIVFIVIK